MRLKEGMKLIQQITQTILGGFVFRVEGVKEWDLHEINSTLS